MFPEDGACGVSLPLEVGCDGAKVVVVDVRKRGEGFEEGVDGFVAVSAFPGEEFCGGTEVSVRMNRHWGYSARRTVCDSAVSGVL